MKFNRKYVTEIFAFISQKNILYKTKIIDHYYLIVQRNCYL
jgi:hypothetical protein